MLAFLMAWAGWQVQPWIPGLAFLITQWPATMVVIGLFLRGRHRVAAWVPVPAHVGVPAPLPPTRRPVEAEVAVPVGASLAAVVSLAEHREQRRAA